MITSIVFLLIKNDGLYDKYLRWKEQIVKRTKYTAHQKNLL